MVREDPSLRHREIDHIDLLKAHRDARRARQRVAWIAEQLGIELEAWEAELEARGTEASR